MKVRYNSFVNQYECLIAKLLLINNRLRTSFLDLSGIYSTFDVFISDVNWLFKKKNIYKICLSQIYSLCHLLHDENSRDVHGTHPARHYPGHHVEARGYRGHGKGQPWDFKPKKSRRRRGQRGRYKSTLIANNRQLNRSIE